MTALPMALRERFQSLIEEGNCARAAARRLKVSAATGVRWAQKLRQDGSIDIQRMGYRHKKNRSWPPSAAA